MAVCNTNTHKYLWITGHHSLGRMRHLVACYDAPIESNMTPAAVFLGSTMAACLTAVIGVPSCRPKAGAAHR